MKQQWFLLRDWVSDDRSVSPVIATVLVVAITLVIATAIGATVFGLTDRLGETRVAAGDDQCVLESIEFDPNDVEGFADDRLSSACVIWFDADQTAYSDTDTVDRWEDLSPNGFDLTSSDEASVHDPVWRADVGGLAAVQFDRSNVEGLSTTVNTSETDIVGDTTLSTTALVYVQAGTSTIFQVGRPVSGVNEYFRYGYNDNTSNFGSTTIPWYAFADVDAPPASQFYGHGPTAGSSRGRWVVVSYIHDGTELEAYINGESRGGQAGRLDISDGSIQVGYETNNVGVVSGNSLNGSIAELVVFEEALTDEEREVIECSLDRKHGAAVSVAGC